MRTFCALLVTCALAQASPTLSNLQPGGTLVIQQNIDVNIVAIGFSGVSIPPNALSQLPGFTGVPRATPNGPFMSQRFDFHYHLVQAPSWFEDLFFATLHGAAFPQNAVTIFPGVPPLPLSLGQAFYDFCNVDPAYDPSLACSFNPFAPRVNPRFITQNYLISAPYVEKLLSHVLGPALGVDVTRPTVVLINWYGRSDYLDHIYLDPSEPDPETGFPRGFTLGNELAGFGGTAQDDPETCADGNCIFHRLWFYDVSAGPMLFSGSEDLVSASPRFIGLPPLPAGQFAYRVHHIADYLLPTSDTYRPLNTLIPDLGKIVEIFVAGIAHMGPVYPPGLTPPRQPHHIVLDVNRWSWDPASSSFAGLLDVPRIKSKMDKLPYDVGVEITAQTDAPDSRLGKVWDCSLTSMTSVALGQSCFGNRNGGFAFADLYSYFTNHLFQFLTGAPDYEVPIFQFETAPDRLQLFLGIADSNLAAVAAFPGTFGLRQTYVYTSSTVAYDRAHGHGNLLEHEVGHHLGFSHPFNGYRCLSDDCASIASYGQPDTFYSMVGRNVTGLMTYVSVNNDYSQFELDNLRRWLTYEYLDLSNFVAGKIEASPRADKVATALSQADASLGPRSARIRRRPTTSPSRVPARPMTRFWQRPTRSMSRSRPTTGTPCGATPPMATASCATWSTPTSIPPTRCWERCPSAA
jgi:hypothetical protein